MYIAHSGSASPTEFVLTELGTGKGSRRAVLDDPRQGYLKRIMYERCAEGRVGPSATIGSAKCGTRARIEFQHEGD